MDIPPELRYSSDHEWVRVEDGRVRVGITDYAQDALGDVVFVDLPEVGATVEQGATCSEVESTKSVSEIYAPVSGTIVEVNGELADEPTAAQRGTLRRGLDLHRRAVRRRRRSRGCSTPRDTVR